jgi:hypothetical protein
VKQRASRYFFLLILLVLGFWGWQRWGSGPWRIVSQIDSDSNVKFDQLLFLDALRGFAFGHSSPEAGDTLPAAYDVRDDLRADEAWVYATVDGGLHRQARQPLGKGYIVAAITVPKGPIVLVQRFMGQDNEWHGSIRTSKDDGATWGKKDFAEDLVGLEFFDAARGFAWGNGPSGTSRLYYTDDGAETLTPIDLPPDVSLQTDPPALRHDGSVFYLHENKLIHSIRQPDGRWRKEVDQLPSSLTGSMLYANSHSDDKSVWIVAEEPKTNHPPDIVQARLLRWDGPGKIETVPSLSFPKGYMLDAMFVDESLIAIIGADYSGESAFAPVSVFRSEDGGQSWRSERPAIRAKARPVTFYGGKIWAVGTNNRLQNQQ